jgi:putative nucleotidyltransferase with HDIG domain
MTGSGLQNIIDNMPNLPTMPNVVMEAMNLIGNPKSNINQLSDIISKDSSITMQILKLVNSAYYGFPTQITTINRAMALLGLNKVKSLIMSVAIQPMMMSHHSKDLWEHSIRCAVGCQVLSKSLGHDETDEAFVMGLLHDIGKTIFEIHNKNALTEINRIVKLGVNELQAEKMVFGFDHTEVGEQLVKKWKLPILISNCVKHHHTPQLSENISMVGIVYVANEISQQKLKYPILDPEIVDSLDFDIPDPEKLREEIFEMSQSIINALAK